MVLIERGAAGVEATWHLHAQLLALLTELPQHLELAYAQDQEVHPLLPCRTVMQLSEPYAARLAYLV